MGVGITIIPPENVGLGLPRTVLGNSKFAADRPVCVKGARLECIAQRQAPLIQPIEGGPGRRLDADGHIAVIVHRETIVRRRASARATNQSANRN